MTNYIEEKDIPTICLRVYIGAVIDTIFTILAGI